MDTKFKRIDENEVQVEFSGQIIICYEHKSEFDKALQELIDQYAI